MICPLLSLELNFPCGVTLDSSRTVVVIKLRRTSASVLINFVRISQKLILVQK